MVILLVHLEMLNKLVDPLREERDLDLRRPCIIWVDAVLINNCGFLALVQGHAAISFPPRRHQSPAQHHADTQSIPWGGPGTCWIRLVSFMYDQLIIAWWASRGITHSTTPPEARARLLDDNQIHLLA